MKIYLFNAVFYLTDSCYSDKYTQIGKSYLKIEKFLLNKIYRESEREREQERERESKKKKAEKETSDGKVATTAERRDYHHPMPSTTM